MTREEMIDRFVQIYGFENEITIEFCELAESATVSNETLECLLKCHEENPMIYEDEEEEE